MKIGFKTKSRIEQKPFLSVHKICGPKAFKNNSRAIGKVLFLVLKFKEKQKYLFCSLHFHYQKYWA
jgi:hypothetical protein